MSRFANLPLAARLAAAFGLQAIALVAVTLLALNTLGALRTEVRDLAARDVRAVSLAGEVGQHVQTVGRMTADHLYVHDGDLKSQDAIAERIARMSADVCTDAGRLQALRPGSADLTRQLEGWSDALTTALERSRAETVPRIARSAAPRSVTARATSTRARSRPGRTPSSRRWRSSRTPSGPKPLPPPRPSRRASAPARACCRSSWPSR